jgi:DNA methylase
MIARIDQDDTLPLDQVVHGECLSVMRSFPDNSVDSIITDPPAGISFMNKDFDSNRGGRDKWILWLSTIMKEALRVLRPGGHCLVWSLPRTSHWTGLALEQAGFEMRDCLYHTQAQDSAMAAFEASLTETQRDALARLVDSQETYPAILALFGSGFPKSQNISAMIDKHFHAEREVIGPKIRLGDKKPYAHNPTPGNEWNERYGLKMWRDPETAPSTDDAKRFAGYGSALKPACENWWLCRKPLSEKTLALNVLRWNCGGLNIDKSRVPSPDGLTNGGRCVGESGLPMNKANGVKEDRERSQPHNSGRFPSHVLFSHSLFCTDTVCDPSCPVLALEQQSGVRKSGGREHSPGVMPKQGNTYGMTTYATEYAREPSTGTASRFFHCFTPDVPFLYCAKSSRSERNMGCEGLEPAQTFDKNTSKRIAHINHETGDTTYNDYTPSSNQNTHPTVKPQSLLRYLISMITPDNGIVLDMFFGSGSTGVAAIAEGYHFIGIEQSDTPQEPYCTIARVRIAHAMRGVT